MHSKVEGVVERIFALACLCGLMESFPVKGSGAIGSAPVSKTGGCGFESLLPC